MNAMKDSQVAIISVQILLVAILAAVWMDIN